MTRTFNHTIKCTECGHTHTTESEFGRWMRHHPQLESMDGIVCFDLDILMHRYKHITDGKGDRSIQCVMFIEIKSEMTPPTASQRDTLYMIDQVMRNRRKTVNSTPRAQAQRFDGTDPRHLTKVWSAMLKRDVTLQMYGGHLLQLDHTSPANSKQMVWDKKHDITHDQLIGLLRFEIDPDDPSRTLDHRRRSADWSRMQRLPGID